MSPWPAREVSNDAQGTVDRRFDRFVVCCYRIDLGDHVSAGPTPRAVLPAFMCAVGSVLVLQGEPMMRPIVAAVICTAVIVGQIGTASAQYYGPPGGYYYYGSPAGICCALSPLDLGWAYTRNQPVGYGEPYPATRMADGTLACEHSNYRPIRGWCRRIW